MLTFSATLIISFPLARLKLRSIDAAPCAASGIRVERHQPRLGWVEEIVRIAVGYQNVARSSNDSEATVSAPILPAAPNRSIEIAQIIMSATP